MHVKPPVTIVSLFCEDLDVACACSIYAMDVDDTYNIINTN